MKHLIIITLILFFSATIAHADNNTYQFMQSYMKSNNLTGTIIIESLNGDKVYTFNKTRSTERFLPASTFKIPNTLIALQEKAVKDETDTFQWNGHVYDFPDWNKDQNLKSAFQASCVWFYQELAKKIGNGKYLKYLKTLNYGNMKTGTSVESFWLDGDLRISAAEQVEFLKNCYLEKFPFDKNCYQILKNLMIVDKNDKYTLRAKTGTTARVSPSIGWYVGYIETEMDVYFFACNIDMSKPEHSKFRKDIVYAALKELNIIK